MWKMLEISSRCVALIRDVTAIILIIASILSLSTIVTEYDEQTETITTELQRKTESFFIDLESNGNLACPYKEYAGFYKDARADLTVLLTRANAIKNNDMTVSAVNFLIKTLKEINDAYKKLTKDQCFNPEFLKEKHSTMNGNYQAILNWEIEKKMRGLWAREKKLPN